MKLFKWVIVILVCIGVVGSLAWVKYSQIQAAMEMAASFPEPMESVEFAVAKEVTWQPTLSVKAEAVAIQSVELRNELEGRIVEVNFRPGDTVKAGQILVRLDTSEEVARLQAARAQTRLAQLEHERNTQLVEKRVISESESDRTYAERDASSAAERQLEAIIEKMAIRAPFDGVAGLHELEVGQYLNNGALITRLVGVNDEIWIDFNLPQHQANLQINDSIELSTSQSMNIPPNARIIARDAWVDTTSRNVRYRALADNREYDLFPGSAISVIVPNGEQQTSIVIPTTAIRYDTIGTHVFVLVPAEPGTRGTDRASRRSVNVGPEKDQMIYVLSGLKAGDRIATSGAFKLREGILVNAKKPSPDITVSTLN